MSYLIDLVHEIHASGQSVDVMVAELAGRQHGVVAHWQLKALGLERGAITHRLAAGRLHRLHAGVYAVGHRKITYRGRWMAGVLACGPDAVLSHRNAAALWNLLPYDGALVHVTFTARGRRAFGHIRPHQPRRLHPDDATVVDGIPVTSVARTLLDLAATGPARRLERAFEAAERERTLDMRRVNELLGRGRGHRGHGPLVTVIEQFTEPPPHVRSRLERRFFDLCAAAGLPRPEVNAWVEGYEVDMLWRDEKVVVELDSWRFHGTRAAFERDRRRDVKLRLAGFQPTRFTWRRLATEPEELVGDVRGLIALNAAVAVQ
jgi:predicted transcriptional regulator of viral defense system